MPRASAEHQRQPSPVPPQVECTCGHQFCFACCEAQHSPCTCDMLRDWVQRMRDGSETSSWLSANTKLCPKCSKPVEKNGG